MIAGGACVLLACLAWILYGPADVLPPYVIGLIAGVGSGAAMLTYTVSKEANPLTLSGTATGAVSFLNLTFSALVGPLFGWIMKDARAARRADLAGALSDYVSAPSLWCSSGRPAHAGVEGDRAGGACPTAAAAEAA